MGRSETHRLARALHHQQGLIPPAVQWNGRTASIWHASLNADHIPPRGASSTTSLPEASEKATNVGREEFRFFHCREMAATRHVGPLGDIEHAFQPYAWRVVNLFRKVCKAHRRQYPLSGGETHGLQAVFPVHLNCGTNALGVPVERQVGKQLIF